MCDGHGQIRGRPCHPDVGCIMSPTNSLFARNVPDLTTVVSAYRTSTKTCFHDRKHLTLVVIFKEKRSSNFFEYCIGVEMWQASVDNHLQTKFDVSEARWSDRCLAVEIMGKV